MRSPLKVDALFALLDLAGLRSSDVADALGVSRPTVTNWRKGNHSLSPEHYTALVRLVESYETTWLAIHRAKTKHTTSEEPIPGTTVQVQVYADNYKGHMHQSVRACLKSLCSMTGESLTGWDYNKLCEYTEQLAGMARSLRIILQDPEEKESQ